MPRIIEQPAPEFCRKEETGVRTFNYDIELITPMAGGGAESWKPDTKNPVRTQAIKGQLRFWWRTMQAALTAAELKQREDAIWGTTDTASPVRLSVEITDGAATMEIPWGEGKYLLFKDAEVPEYVLFPLQNLLDPGDECKLINRLSFTLTVHCNASQEQTVRNTVKLWILFGGLGARTRRGCGSLYSEEVMDEFHTPEAIAEFIQQISPENPIPQYTSPFPTLGNCRLAMRVNSHMHNPVREWCSFLNSYGDFRQTPGIGRRRGTGKKPGRSFWPEADTLRRKTGNNNNRHKPEHPAGNWFPRGAYGLPIQTEFPNSPGDPNGKFFLQPEGAGKERWPSPVFLKILKMNDSTVIRICLILNHGLPEPLEIIQKQGKTKQIIHEVTSEEMPLNYQNKHMPNNANILHSGEHPYDALIRHLGVQEVL